MAKTKIQVEVSNLSAFLPRMKPAEELEALRSYALIYAGKEYVWCSCCGHQWKEGRLWNNRKLKKAVCPHCGAKANIKRSPGKKVHNEKWYFTLVRVSEGWQVVRNYFCESYVRKGEQMEYFSCVEVSQVWMKPGCPTVFMGRSVNGACGACDQWKLNTPITVKYDHYRYRLSGDVSEYVELIPMVKRNGLSKIRKNAGVVEQLEAIIKDPKAEIIAKAKQWDVFEYYCSHDYAIKQMWSSLRIAMKHRYIIKDSGLWLDYLSELHRQGKDIHNPKFICPANLKKAHDDIYRERRLKTEKRVAELQRLEMERIARESESLSAEYRDRLKNLLDIEVSQGKIVLRPLQDLYDFYLEGTELHHCVYANRYYKKENSLIISARVAGKRTETIELDIKSGKIIQCRGKFNKNSNHHQKIYSLMERNINKFISYGNNQVSC